MTRSADKWNGNMADSVEITGKGVAGKAKRIEECNKLHVMAGIFVRRAVMSAQHKADGDAGTDIHDSGHDKAHAEHQDKTAAEGGLYPFFFPGAIVLGHKDRGRGAAAVAEGVGKAFDPCRCGIGRDHIGAAGIYRALHEQYPGIQVKLCSGYSTELLAQLNSHQIDLGIISEREGEHNWLPLMQDELTAWLPQSHPMAEFRAFPVVAFASEPYIETYPGKDIDNARVFARCGITPDLKFSTMDSLATYSMVEAGLGVSMNNAINGRAWSGKVRILPLDPPQRVELGIASLPDLVPAAEKFLVFLKERLEEFQVNGCV